MSLTVKLDIMDNEQQAHDMAKVMQHLETLKLIAEEGKDTVPIKMEGDLPAVVYIKNAGATTGVWAVISSWKFQ